MKMYEFRLKFHLSNFLGIEVEIEHNGANVHKAK